MSISTEKDEIEITLTLIKHFDKFNKFYHNEWKPRKIPASWFIDNNLSTLGLTQYNSNKRSYNITLRYVPTEDNIERDAFIVAHEMYHAIRIDEDRMLKFHGIGVDSLELWLREMFEGPIVDSFLQTRYKFDLKRIYKDSTNFIIKQLEETYPDTPINKANELAFFIQLATIKINWNLIENYQTDPTWREYVNLLKSKYSEDIINKIDDIVSIVHHFGTVTKDQQRDVFLKINEKFRLGPFKLSMFIIIDNQST